MLLRNLQALLLLCVVAACSCQGTRGGGHADGDADSDGDGDEDSGPGPCSDQDGDGYGLGSGCTGDDCDDLNDDIQECECGPDGRGHSAGCACDTLQPEACYEGEPRTVGIGECVTGLRSCIDGVWSSCIGQIRNDDESCDYADNDCDGVVDNGVLGPCGDCNDDCTSLDWGPTQGTPFNPDDSNSSGVVLTPEQFLTLSQQAVSSRLIWIANSLDGTISKFDTGERVELARYRTGPLGGSGGMWGGDGENPSRTSVNYFGDAYIANRVFGGRASATKILADRCPEHGDGVVNTSQDGSDVLDWTEAGPEDDCIAWHTEVGGNFGIGRSIAAQTREELDGSHEYAWMGIFSEQKYYEIDGETGELTGVEVVLQGVTPYGAAIDAEGNLWSASLGSTIGRFDTYNPDDTEVIQTQFNYGITVDALGHVWTNGSSIRRYRPEDAEWDTVAGSAYENGGIAIDAEGFVWTHHDSGLIQRVDSNDPDLPLTAIRTGRGGRGVAVDSDGYIWGINWTRDGSDGDVTIIDPADPENFDTICCDSINNSYTYSDMTGVQLGIATAPRGTYELVAEGCEAPQLTSWSGIRVDGDLPVDTGVRVEVRTAATLAELGRAEWIFVGSIPPDESPLDVRAALDLAGVEHELYLGVRFTLESFDRESLPVIESIGVQRSCSNSFG